MQQTGAYPHLIQLLCDEMIEQLKRERALRLTQDHLDRANHSRRVRDALEESFYINTGPGAQLLVYHLVERDSFTLAEAHTQLEEVVAREVPLRVIEDILRQLERSMIAG